MKNLRLRTASSISASNHTGVDKQPSIKIHYSSILSISDSYKYRRVNILHNE